MHNDARGVRVLRHVSAGRRCTNLSSAGQPDEVKHLPLNEAIELTAESVSSVSLSSCSATSAATVDPPPAGSFALLASPRVTAAVAVPAVEPALRSEHPTLRSPALAAPGPRRPPQPPSHSAEDPRTHEQRQRPPDRRRPPRTSRTSSSPPREHPATVAELRRAGPLHRRRPRPWAPSSSTTPTTRWYHRLRTGPGYEVWLLQLGARPGQRTARPRPLLRRAHRPRRRADRAHASAARARWRRARSGCSRPATCTRSSTTRLEPAVSLHVYFPGLTEMPMHPSPPPAPRCRSPCSRTDRATPAGRHRAAGSVSPGNRPLSTSAC